MFTHKGLCRVTRCVDYIQVLEDTLRAYVLGHKGRRAFALSEITIVIRQVYGWHHSRHCMEGHVDHRYVGPRWERALSLVLI